MEPRLNPLTYEIRLAGPQSGFLHQKKYSTVPFRLTKQELRSPRTGVGDYIISRRAKARHIANELREVISHSRSEYIA